MSVTVVRVRGDDWHTVRDVRLAALSEAPYAFGSTYEREVDQTEADWREWVEPSDEETESAVFVALEGSDPVGMVAVYEEDDESARLIAMWVAPPARKQGVGIALVNAVFEWARDRDFEAITLDVADDNKPAVALYKKIGFEATGQTRPLPSAPDRRVAEYSFRLR